MITFSKHSGIYTLKARQILPLSLDEAWMFISDPQNLAKLTPTHMGFKITSGQTDEMYPGQIISYRIALLPGVYTSWVTEITHVQRKKYFVDEQRFGPYKMWHHEHFLEKSEDGVIMQDKVSYKLPMGIVGGVLGSALINKQLRNIFTHRFQVLEQMFPVHEQGEKSSETKVIQHPA